MSSIKLKRKVSLIYLIAVPIVGFAMAFGIGHSNYKIYFPLWLINVVLMVYASWTLGLNVVKLNDSQKTLLAKGAFFLIIPLILTSIFAGIGIPPETISGWLETEIEQKIRYFILVISGVFIAYGFVLLREKLKRDGENFYSLLAWTSISIAIPLFILNMLYWGFFLPELFKIQMSSGIETKPEWFIPIRQLFGLISIAEVALTYVATGFIAIALNLNGLLSKISFRIYLSISIMAFVIIVLSAFLQQQMAIPNFIVSIPAVPFLMPYFIALNILNKLGKEPQ